MVIRTLTVIMLIMRKRMLMIMVMMIMQMMIMMMMVLMIMMTLMMSGLVGGPRGIFTGLVGDPLGIASGLVGGLLEPWSVEPPGPLSAGCRRPPPATVRRMSATPPGHCQHWRSCGRDTYLYVVPQNMF